MMSLVFPLSVPNRAPLPSFRIFKVSIALLRVPTGSSGRSQKLALTIIINPNFWSLSNSSLIASVWNLLSQRYKDYIKARSQHFRVRLSLWFTGHVSGVVTQGIVKNEAERALRRLTVLMGSVDNVEVSICHLG